MSHHFVYTFVLFSSTIFFSIIAILGIPYGGSASSNIYQLFCIGCFMASMFFFISDFAKCRHTQRQFISILVMLFYAVSGIFSGYTSDKSFLGLAAFGIPAACIAMYYSGIRSISFLVRWLDVIVLLLTLSLFFMVSVFYNGVVSGSTESSYSQNLSYFAAFGFLADIFLVRYGKLYPRFTFFNTRFYRIVSFLFLPFYPAVIFLSGGRGGFVTIAVGLLLFYVTYKGSRATSLWFISVLVLLFVVVGGAFIGRGSSDFRYVMDTNTSRVFSYFSNGGIDMSQTSGRDVVFSKSFEMAMERPVMGYGLFGYKEQLMKETHQGYPHNIFLELFLQGGLLFLSFGIILILSFIKKLVKLVRSNPQMIMLLPLVVYPFTELMYTGSYMEDPFFWFCMVFVFNYQFPTKLRLNHLYTK